MAELKQYGVRNGISGPNALYVLINEYFPLRRGSALMKSSSSCLYYQLEPETILLLLSGPLFMDIDSY
jgi:hypothetical protein